MRTSYINNTKCTILKDEPDKDGGQAKTTGVLDSVRFADMNMSYNERQGTTCRVYLHVNNAALKRAQKNGVFGVDEALSH